MAAVAVIEAVYDGPDQGGGPEHLQGSIRREPAGGRFQSGQLGPDLAGLTAPASAASPKEPPYSHKDADDTSALAPKREEAPVERIRRQIVAL
mmetsp:Transcript_113401/g.366855  ORF Transcript_113401/g.366855 Transcript_113401/m.366855 type:complete len:93 (+) Transcript_113401:3845-4123(+)